ncbi:rRNA maturation RNase YbeY [Chloroflexi bacterium TSY]|nr:rRNA maturation RNase YbeY [Chloroflexi bacterium TSY]
MESRFQTDSHYSIEILVDEPYRREVDTDKILYAVSTILHQENIAEAALTLLITNNEEVQRLNLTHRQIDVPTDVLSFANHEPVTDTASLEPQAFHIPPELVADDTMYLGDIVIAFPYTKKQAISRQQTLTRELQLLAIHGTLHLLGYDHATEDEEKEMWRRQDAALLTITNKSE